MGREVKRRVRYDLKVLDLSRWTELSSTEVFKCDNGASFTRKPQLSFEYVRCEGPGRHLGGDVKHTPDTTIPRLGKRLFCPGDKNTEAASIFKVMTLNGMAQGKYKALGWRALPP